MEAYSVYHDLKERTGGQLLIGIVGPVRTGKSTFIRHFMELTALAYMEENARKETMDQLPVSGSGKIITTVEPKFIPREAVQIHITEELSLKLRMIDCVGFLVKDATGSRENDQERLVKTPWSKQAIPFGKAADYGTQKVIREHATVGIMVTTDGSFGEIPRENFVPAEEKTIAELQTAKKPFVILLNTQKPYKEETKLLIKSMQEKYGVPVTAVNCEQLKQEDILKILEMILSEFPVLRLSFYIPRWAEILPTNHPLKQKLLACARHMAEGLVHMRDVRTCPLTAVDDSIRYCGYENIDTSTGSVDVRLELKEEYYYRTLTELTGTQIDGEYDLVRLLRQLSTKKTEYDRVLSAVESVRQSGYGVVLPLREEIRVDTPEVIHQGSRYGVRLKAASPTVHMIRADIETEVAPIVGSEEQANDLIKFIEEKSAQGEDLMDVKIFGKSIEQLMEEGIQTKVANISTESQTKLQSTMKKIVNDSKGGMICIII